MQFERFQSQERMNERLWAVTRLPGHDKEDPIRNLITDMSGANMLRKRTQLNERIW